MVERLMTLPEVATYLGVPEKTIYKWRSCDSGPRGIRVGRYVRWRSRDVEAWLERQSDPRPAA